MEQLNLAINDLQQNDKLSALDESTKMLVSKLRFSFDAKKYKRSFFATTVQAILVGVFAFTGSGLKQSKCRTEVARLKEQLSKLRFDM